MKRKKIWILAAVIAAGFAFVPLFGGFVAKAETGEISANNEAVLVEGNNGGILHFVQNDRTDGNPLAAGRPSPLSQGAQETVEEGVIEETEGSVWFKEKILPYVMEYGAAALGVLSAVLVTLKKLRTTIAELVGAYNALKKANEDSEATKAEVAEIKNNAQEFMKEQAAAQREFMENQAAAMQTFMEGQKAAMEKGFQQIAAGVTDKLEDACDTVHKILDVEELAFEENPALVSNGTSKKIAEVIHSGEKTQDKHGE